MNMLQTLTIILFFNCILAAIKQESDNNPEKIVLTQTPVLPHLQKQNSDYQSNNESSSGPSKPVVEPQHYNQNYDDYSDSVRRVDNSDVNCLKNHMEVILNFSAPFNGYIYPYGHFGKCILFTGRNSHAAILDLAHGICGNKVLKIHENPDFTARIEHRLMIQWERDYVGEEDSSIIVRCDRPDVFNKTISWNFGAQKARETIEISQHPGPKMWMDIQRGEGPNSPLLDSKPVYTGDVLTMMFTLQDNVFWFGSNILACTVVDGGSDNAGSIEHYSETARTQEPRTSMTVIENGCSIKPNLFSHFLKERATKNGNLINVYYAHFKAFRFAESHKIVVQCNVKVCYKNCEPLPPCSTGFQPRVKSQRRRREADQSDDAFVLDTVGFYRTIDVYSPEDIVLKQIPVESVNDQSRRIYDEIFSSYCYSSTTFFGGILILSFVTVSLFMTVVYYCIKTKNSHLKM